MTECREQMSLAGSWVAESDHVEGAIDKASIAQSGEGGAHLGRQPLQIEAAQGLLPRELGLLEQPGDASGIAFGRFHFGQGLEILRMTQPFGCRSLAERAVL